MSHFSCPTCHATLQRPQVGGTVCCPRCGQHVIVPSPAAASGASLGAPAPPPPEPRATWPRCYDCGRVVDPDEALRRDVVVSRESSSSTVWVGKSSAAVFGTARRVERVDLCPDCDGERNRLEWVKRLRSERLLRELWRGLLIGLSVVIAFWLAILAVILLFAK